MYSSKVVAGVDIATADQYNRLRTDAMGASYLLVHAQNTPNNTFRVESGFWYNGTSRVDVAQLASTSVTAPAGFTRIDLVSVNTSGTVVYTTGIEGGSAPAIPSGNFVLAEIHCRVGGTTVQDTDDSINHYIVDRRNILNLGGSSSSVGTISVDLIFDNGSADLPATTATPVDGYTVVNLDTAYVKNSSVSGHIGKTYTASVSGGSITWNLTQTVAAGNWIYCINGTVYINKLIPTGSGTVLKPDNIILPTIKKVTGATWTSGTSKVITDADCTVNSVIMGWTITAGTQVWFWQFTVAAGQFTINSTASETSLTFNYVLYI